MIISPSLCLSLLLSHPFIPSLTPSLPSSLSVAKMNKGGMGKGAVAGIVIVIFLVLLIAVDATCCYTNHCGMLMFLAVKLFGQKVPGMKTVEEGDGTSNG